LAKKKGFRKKKALTRYFSKRAHMEFLGPPPGEKRDAPSGKSCTPRLLHYTSFQEWPPSKMKEKKKKREKQDLKEDMTSFYRRGGKICSL